MIRTRILNAILMFTAAGALLLGALFLLLVEDKTVQLGIPTAHIVAGGMRIPVSIADTPTLRQQGLSETPLLAPGTGKLFIFDKAGSYGFWMKDMRYPIDIIWIDGSHTVIGITPNLAPDTYPEVFYPPSPVQYVLEVNAGEALEGGLSIGTVIGIDRAN